MKLGVTLDILNQKATPAFFADTLANRPAFGFEGRIFVDTNVPSTGLYRDTGSSWIQIADQGAGTTGTLQQVTTNGNTTSQGISITAGGLTSNNVTLVQNAGTIKTSAISQVMATNDKWEIYGIGTSAGLGQGELIFSVGDDGSPYASGGERFRFTYGTDIVTGTAKDVFIVDYDLSYFNTSLGVNTDTPTAAFDVHSGVSVIAQLNQTTATNNSLLAFQNAGAGLWRIGNFYNAGANDFGVFDVIGSTQRITIKKTTGQTFIGTETTSSGLLVVNSSTGDNQIVAIGANSPSIRVRNAGTSPTRQFGLGLATASNNFIQGTTGGEFCIFNASTTASPILFGIFNSGTGFVEEDARISAAGNFLIGTTTDNGSKLQVSGAGNVSGNFSVGSTFQFSKFEVYTALGASVGINHSSDAGTYPRASGIGLGANSTSYTVASGGSTISFIGGAGMYAENTASSGNPTNLVFWTNSAGTPAERARISSGGSVLINRSSDINTLFKLQIEGRTLINSNQYGLLLTQNAGTSGVYLGADTQATNTDLLFTSGTTGGTIASINGTTGVYTPLSDINKKKNFETSNLGLDAILKLKPTLYNILNQKDNEPKELGFIAQEVKEIINQAYVENGDFIGLNYQPIVAAVVKAIQELNTKIENLK